MYCLPKSILEHDIGSSSQSALPTISLLDFFTLLIPPLHLVYRWSSKYSTPLSSVEKHSKDFVFSQNSVIFVVSVSFAQNSEQLRSFTLRTFEKVTFVFVNLFWKQIGEGVQKIVIKLLSEKSFCPKELSFACLISEWWNLFFWVHKSFIFSKIHRLPRVRIQQPS